MQTQKGPEVRKGPNLVKGMHNRKGPEIRKRSDQWKGIDVKRDIDLGKDANQSDDKVSDTTGTKLWKYRPFSRVVRGYRAYQVVRDYVQLNELEAQRKIPYRKSRLKGLSSADWEILWA